jgi:hypothetical protein
MGADRSPTPECALSSVDIAGNQLQVESPASTQRERLMNRRFLLSFASLLLAAAGAHAADGNGGRRYVVMSLVGDTLSIVTNQRKTGSNLDTNTHQIVSAKDAGFDTVALQAAGEALQKMDPQTAVVLLAASTPALFSDQSGLFDGRRLTLPTNVDAIVRGEKGTHLLLLTKHRAEARVEFTHEFLGSGKIEGLGFYLDNRELVVDPASREASRGYLAPFVYVRLTLVDLATSTVVRDELVTATRTLFTSQSKDGISAWDALTSSEKLGALRQMLTAEVTRVVPTMVAAP